MNSILLLHGALGSSLQMEPLQQKLEQTGRKAYTFNFSGHGGKIFTNDFGIEAFAKEVIDFLNEKNIESIDIFGYSMGGYAGMWAAYLEPKLINRICTLGTKLNWSAEAAEKATSKLDLEEIRRKVPAYAQTLERIHGVENVSELLSKTSGMMKRLGQIPLLTESVFGNLQIPVTIGFGDRDDHEDLIYSERISHLIPDCSFFTLKDTPHPFEKVNIDLLMPYL